MLQIYDEFLTRKKAGGTELEVLPGATVNVYSAGATANGDGSGTTVTVFDSSTLVNGETLEVNGETMVIQSIPDGTSFTHNNASLTWSDLDRFLRTDDEVQVYEDSAATSALTQPLTAAADGRIQFYPAHGARFDVKAAAASGENLIKPDILQPKAFDEVIDAVTDYGVKTDGTDTATELQAAVDAADGKILQLPAGTMTIGTAINFDSLTAGIHLRGAGPGLSTIFVEAAALSNGLEQLDTDAVSHIFIEDLTIDGNDANQASGTGNGMNIRNCSSLRIQNCEVKNFRGNGIVASATDVAIDTIWIEDCNVHDVCSNSTGLSGISISSAQTVDRAIVINNILNNIGDGASTITGTGIQCSGASLRKKTVISGNVVTGCDASGITLQSQSEDVVISGNVISDIGKCGLADGGNGIFSSAAENLIISNNSIDTIDAAADNGIEASGSDPDNIVIVGNRITGVGNSSKFGISIGDCDRITVQGNSIHDCSGGGIDCLPSNEADDLAIQGNSVVNCSGATGIRTGSGKVIAVNGNLVDTVGANGIDVRDGTGAVTPISDISVSDNIVRDPTSRGIYIRGEASGSTDAERVTVADNIVSGAGSEGIQAEDVNGLSIKGNTVEDSGDSGIALYTVSDFLVIDNIVRNNGTGAGQPDDGITLGATVFANGLIDQNVIVDNVSSGARAILDLGATLTNVKVGRNNIIAGNTNDEISLTLIQGTFGVNATDPSILGFDQWVTANAAGTILASLVDGVSGDVKTIIFNDTNTTVSFVGASLSGNGGVNVIPAVGDSMRCEFDGTVWHCTFNRASRTIGTLGTSSTPNISNSDVWATAAGAPVTITTLDNGVVGQTVTILVTEANTTFDFSGGGNMKGNAGVDFNPGAGSTVIATYDGTNWYCVVGDGTV